jgi:DNA-binding beta-propeller fold protein YncE
MEKTDMYNSLSTVRRKALSPSGVCDCLHGHARHLLAVIVVIVLIAPAAPLLAEPVAVDRVRGFQSPTRVALTSWGHIFVADHDHGVVAVLDSTGKRIATLKGLKAPLGLAVFETADAKQKDKDKDKSKKDKTPPYTVYVGDEADGSVRIFVDGVIVGTLGNGSGEFGKPNGIAVTQTGISYVVDSEADQVKVYDAERNLQFSFGASGSGDGQLNFPTDIVVDETRGVVYVADFWNGRIAVFDLAGVWLRNILPPPNDSGDPIFFRAAGLGTDPAGNLYVVDNALSCVAIIDGEGALIDAIGYRDGKYWTGDLAVPVDAAADGERIYVTSNRQRLLVVFEVIP